MTHGGFGDNSCPVTTAPPPRPAPVAVIAEGDITDAALCSLIERVGIPAVAVAPRGVAANATATAAGAPAPTYRAAIVRSPDRLALIDADPTFDGVARIGLGFRVGDPAGCDIPDGPGAAAHLLGYLHDSTIGRVRLTAREREILVSYVLGATMRETAVAHNIAESTVREHYRRVTQRYEEAGRPVGNKAQLLIHLVADGWVRHGEILAIAGAGHVEHDPGLPHRGAA